MTKLQRILYTVTGGRPMIDRGKAFTDSVSKKSVRYYEDRFGREWMADSGPWSCFRTRANENGHDDFLFG